MSMLLYALDVCSKAFFSCGVFFLALLGSEVVSALAGGTRVVELPLWAVLSDGRDTEIIEEFVIGVIGFWDGGPRTKAPVSAEKEL